MKRILSVAIAVYVIISYASASNVSVQTIIFDANSQPPIVGGVIDGYSDDAILKRGVIVSSTQDNAVYKESENWSDFSWYFDLKDYRIIDCTNIGNEQFWCTVKLLKSNCDYYVRAFVVMKDKTVSLGNIEKLHTKSFNRYSGTSDYANVWYAFSYTLFDLVTDEIINPDDGFYYSTNENPTRVRFQKGTSYNTCYKYATEWNYKLWYYHNTNHCDKNKVVNIPIMTFSNGKLTIQKNPLDANKSITIYYCINGNYFRPETYTNIYSSPISVSSPSTVYCYAISTDGYISYTNMYVINESLVQGNSTKVADAVDLGLSVKWASWNVGAEAPEDKGNLYAWGELSPKTDYSSDTYKFYNNGYTKYGSVDNKYTLDAEDDVAQQTWGEGWRIPTFEELKELKEKCTFKKITLNGVSVTKVVGPNGNYIYFPFPGNYTGKTLYFENSVGSYWSSNLESNSYAKDIDFQNGTTSLNGDTRYHGQAIRPVYVKDSSNGNGRDNNRIVVSDISVHQEQSIVIDVQLENTTTDLTAYQFDLVLPTGFTLATDNQGQYQVTKTDRYENDSQSLNVSSLGNNAYRIVCFSMSNAKIVGTTGAILNADLSISDDVKSGTYEGVISNVIFTKSDGTQIKLSDAKFTIEVSRLIMGDTNGDKEINVSDIVDVINFIMDNPSANFAKTNADLNGDGEVNVTDIVWMVNIIMSGQTRAARKTSNRAGDLTDGDCLTIEDLTMNAGETKQVSVLLNNPDKKYTAFQFDLTLPEGVTIVRNSNGKLIASLDTERKDDHTLNVSELGNNTYRLLAFSMSNAELYGTNGPLVNITLEADANMDSGANAAALKSQVFTATDGTQYKWSDLPFSIQVNGSENTG